MPKKPVGCLLLPSLLPIKKQFLDLRSPLAVVLEVIWPLELIRFHGHEPT